MSLIRVCGRCGASVDKALDGTARNLNIPAASPSTRPVAKDAIVALGVSAPEDLCGPCLLSALVEYALGGAPLAPALVETLQRRITATLAPDEAKD